MTKYNYNKNNKLVSVDASERRYFQKRASRPTRSYVRVKGNRNETDANAPYAKSFKASKKYRSRGAKKGYRIDKQGNLY